MTTHDREAVIAAAKEAGCHHATEDDKGMRHWRCTNADMERLYAIAFERGSKSVDTPVALAEAYRCGEEAGRQAEREACAKICDKYTEFSGSPSNFAENCAKAIRARSVK